MNLPPYKLDFSIGTDREKETIRKDRLRQLKALAPGERAKHSSRMLASLLISPLWLRAGSVLIYHPLRSEPDLTPLLASESHRILLPRVTASGLDLHPYSGNSSLRRSPHGMLEPNPSLSSPLSPGQVDLAIIPGLAFDPQSGLRLGRGGGYYDRLLAEPDFTAIAIGVAFDFQLHEHLPAEEHDQPVEHVLTEAGLRPTLAASTRTPGSA